jgi:hypothetical protein
MTDRLQRFRDWLEGSEPPARILYLQADHAQRDPEVSAFMRRAAERGEVFLTQKRVRPHVYNYFAQRVSRRAGKVLKPLDGK